MSFDPPNAAADHGMERALPPVTVVMTTWFPAGPDGEARLKDAMTTLESWGKHLHYEGRLCLHIADDGSAEGMLPRLAQHPVTDQFLPVSTSIDDRHGVGASLNRGLRHAFDKSGPLVLYAVDDWALSADFDITPWVRMLMGDGRVGMVRLGPPHPGISGTVEAWPEGWVLHLDRHHFANATRPFLVHRRFYSAYGWYAEDETAYEVERLHNLRYCEAQDGPAVVLALPHPWKHIGDVHLADVHPRREQEARV